MKGARAALSAAVIFVAAGAWGTALAGEKPAVIKPCTNCHKDTDGVVRGKLANLSNKADTLQVNVGKAVWLFDFDDATTFRNVEGVKKLKKDKEIAIAYETRGEKLHAVEISTKPKFKVPQEQLVDTGFVSALVKESPGEGGYVLVDARPGPKYHEGHIRNARSMPLFAFDKLKDKVLPEAKDILLVFYCGGVT